MIVGGLKFTWTYRRQMAGDVPPLIEKILLVGEWCLRRLWLSTVRWSVIYLTAFCIATLRLFFDEQPLMPLGSGASALITLGIALEGLVVVLRGPRWFPLQYDEHIEKV